MDKETLKRVCHKGEKRRKFSIEEKLAAIDMAKELGSNRAAAKCLDIDEKRIREWRSQKMELKHKSKPKTRFRLEGGGRKIFNEELEYRLLSFVEGLRAKKIRVTTKMMSRKAKTIWQSLQQENPELTGEFKASQGFIHRFNQRHNLVYRGQTIVTQKPLQDYIPIVASFIKYVRYLRQQNKFGTGDIYSCDETPVWFEGAGTTNQSGSKGVALQTTKQGMMRCTVMLTAKANGKKVKPYVVLKQKRPMSDLEKMFPEIVIAYSDNGWMDESLTADYLNKVIGAFSPSCRLLIWDSYRCHISKSVKEQLERMKIEPAVIPGGCTKFIHPADVSWNRSFEARYNEKYDDWITRNDHKYTAYGQVHAPPLEEILKWIRDAWMEIPEQQIKDSFLHCGMSNALDHSENDLIVCLRGEGLQEGRQLLESESRDTNVRLDDEEEDEDQLEENQTIIDKDEYSSDELH